ncbi:hypothetical protein O6P43_003159 [Quillaja saponaria]|uniref:Uncharacterized protein n=1 Tax=Quillaja saponaria TaxID=32244 RepID=A0AAD7QE13_QUISA|nr:hypothetical protein O6P43_003159 [Quillaja saponaria]
MEQVFSTQDEAWIRFLFGPTQLGASLILLPVLALLIHATRDSNNDFVHVLSLSLLRKTCSKLFHFVHGLSAPYKNKRKKTSLAV